MKFDVQVWPAGKKCNSKKSQVIQVEATSMEEAEKKALEWGKEHLKCAVEAFVW